jgi:ribosomal protein L37E
MATGDNRCAECGSQNLAVESTRDIRRPRQPSDPPDADPPVVARQVWVKCRRCGWSGSVLKRVTTP